MSSSTRNTVLLVVGLAGIFGVAHYSGQMPCYRPAQAKPGGTGKILFYRNPMNPQVTSPTPMKDGMGMDYLPVYENEVKKP